MSKLTDYPIHEWQGARVLASRAASQRHGGVFQYEGKVKLVSGVKGKRPRAFVEVEGFTRKWLDAENLEVLELAHE